MTPIETIRAVLVRHPEGVTPRRMIGAIVGPTCKHSEAASAVRSALIRGYLALNHEMLLVEGERKP